MKWCCAKEFVQFIWIENTQNEKIVWAKDKRWINTIDKLTKFIACDIENQRLKIKKKRKWSEEKEEEKKENQTVWCKKQIDGNLQWHIKFYWIKYIIYLHTIRRHINL